MHEPFTESEQNSALAGSPDRTLVDEILDRLDPLIARQRREVVRHGCLRLVSSTQLHVLYMLDCDGTKSMTTLADALGVTLPNVTGIVDRMVERGLVERVRDEADRRVVAVQPTKEGRSVLQEIDLVRRRTLAAVLELLTPEQQARALQTFTDLRDASARSDTLAPAGGTAGAA